MRDVHESRRERQFLRPVPAPPASDPSSSKSNIQRHPVFCSVCTDLSPASALALFPRVGISVEEGSEGMRNAQWQIKIRLSKVAGAMENGCQSCWLLHEGIKALLKDRLHDHSLSALAVDILYRKSSVLQVTVYTQDEEETADEDSEVSAWLFGEEDPYENREEHVLTCHFYSQAGHWTPWDTIGASIVPVHPKRVKPGQVRHDESRSTSTENLTPIREWVKDCVETHEMCEPSLGQRSVLPRRVVDVGSTTDSDIRLKESDGDVEEAYIALSHCWGSGQRIVTNTATLKDWSQKIPWNLLPKTFQDAIQITRHLGMKYLWIDALCILQDDPQDWKTEAAKMGSYYGDAFLVIAATGAVDGESGCFVEKAAPVSFSGVSGDGRPFEIFAREIRNHSAWSWDVHKDFFKFSENLFDRWKEYPVFGRAWCFQERLLGRRVLHYTREEIVWECLKGLNCECGSLLDFEGDPLIEARRRLATSHSLSRAEVFSLWDDIVVSYSPRLLTRSSDRLAALFGVAQRLASANPAIGAYCAGLWQQALYRGLLWKVISTETAATGLERSGAPTWTWGSVLQGITWIPESDEAEYFVTLTYLPIKGAENSSNDNPTQINTRNIHNQHQHFTPSLPSSFFSPITSSNNTASATAALRVSGPLIAGTLQRVQSTPGKANMPLHAFLDVQGRDVAFAVDRLADCTGLVGRVVYVLKYCVDRNVATYTYGRRVSGLWRRGLVLVRCDEVVEEGKVDGKGKGKGKEKDYGREGGKEKNEGMGEGVDLQRFRRLGIVEYSPLDGPEGKGVVRDFLLV